MALIDIQNASFGYSGQTILNPLSLRVEEGSFIGLVGPNGAGKSTLFKGLLKLIVPVSGAVVYSGISDQAVGYVPQREHLDPIYPLTVWEVARMGVWAKRSWFRPWPMSGEDVSVQRALEQVGMEKTARQPFSVLSGGQRQRVLLARALALHPKVLVLDEPTAGVDPKAEETILTILSELNRSLRITILMVSHHLDCLRGRVSEVWLVRDGDVQTGPAEKLLNAKNVFDVRSTEKPT